MPDSSVQNPFSNPGEIGNIFQLMLDAFRAYDSSGDQRLHTTKELSLDDYTASLLDNYKTDSNITKFELKKAFRQWGNIARFLTFAPKVDELWDVTEHNGVKHLLRKSDDGFNIMNAAAPILKKLPAESAMKVAQRLYDFAHDFRYFCTIHKKTGLLEKYHPILIAMASEKWLGSGKPADIKEGIKALEVMHKWLRRVKDPEKFLKRIEAIGVAGGAKGILLSEKMYQVRAKLEKEPVAEGKKIIAVMDKRTGTVRYMTIAKADEAKLHLPDHELKIGATMITKKGGEKRKVAYMSKNVATICPWFIALGKQHISDKFTEAKKKLDALKVMSQRYPDKLLTEVIDPQMLKTFLLIEHIGGKPILDAAGAKDWSKVEQLINRVYFHVGFEGDDAYKDSLSWVGARGIAQFMKSTYDRLTKRHPHLKTDYKEGTADHVNAIMAQYHLADSWLLHARRKLNGIPSKVEREKLEELFTDQKILRQYMAGSYNGGTFGFRYIRSGKKDAEFLPAYAESITYVKKFDIVYSLGLPQKREDAFDMFAQMKRAMGL